MIKEKVLVVDDEKDIVSLLGYHLHKAGMEIIPAYSGAEAIEKVSAAGPDLIVLDVMMPDPDGFEVCRILRHRGDAALKNVPIVMLTARAEVEDKIKGLSTGADDYVTKPFELKELIIRIENLLAKKRAKEQIEDRVKTLEAKLYKPGDLKAVSAYYHSLDGRLRIKAPGIKGRREKAAEIEQSMACIGGIIKVDASPITGSILIYFDPAHTNVDSIARHLISLDILETPHHGHVHKGESIGQAVGKTAIQTLLERLILAAI
jgi:CheY-like chemotaxis protein